MELGMPVLGFFTNNLDKKNRLFVPSKHREALGETLIVGPSFRDQSLTVFSVDDFNDIFQKAQDALTPDQLDEFQDKFFGQCDLVKPDEQGRITLNAGLVAYAELSGTVNIQGIGHRAKIWNPEIYKNRPQAQSQTPLSELARIAKV